MTLDEARDHIGAVVVYRPTPWTAENGTIERVSDAYVFVHYLGDRSPKATRAADLTFMPPAPTPDDAEGKG